MSSSGDLHLTPYDGNAMSCIEVQFYNSLREHPVFGADIKRFCFQSKFKLIGRSSEFTSRDWLCWTFTWRKKRANAAPIQLSFTCEREWKRLAQHHFPKLKSYKWVPHFTMFQWKNPHKSLIRTQINLRVPFLPGFKYRDCEWKPRVKQFKRKLFISNSTFLPCFLLCCTRCF